MLELFDAPVARDEQNVRVFGPRIDAGNRGMRLGKRGRLAIIRGIGEGFGGGGERESVLGGRGKRGEIGMRVGELGGKRRLGVEEDARGGMAGRLLGAEVGVDALGVLRRAQRAGRRQRVVFFGAFHAEGRLRDVLAGSELAAAVEALGVREGRGTYRGSRLLARTLGSPGAVVLRMSGGENRVTEFVEVSG